MAVLVSVYDTTVSFNQVIRMEKLHSKSADRGLEVVMY